jgi:hypothetical protein
MDGIPKCLGHVRKSVRGLLEGGSEYHRERGLIYFSESDFIFLETNLRE